MVYRITIGKTPVLSLYTGNVIISYYAAKNAAPPVRYTAQQYHFMYSEISKTKHFKMNLIYTNIFTMHTRCGVSCVR